MGLFRMAVLGAVVAVFAAGTASAQTKMVIGYQPTIDVVPLFVAKEEGYFKKHGLDVKLQAGSGAIQVAGVIADSLQIGNPTIPQVLQAVDNGLDLQIVAGGNFMSATADEFAIVIRNGAAINAPQDYVGKRVGVNTINAFLHVIFVEWLKKNGVDPKRVVFVEVPFPQANDVMRQGEIDADVSVQPFVGRMVQANTGRAVTDFVNDFPQGMPVVLYAAKRSYVSANLQAVQGFRAALGEGIEFMKSKPEQTRAYTLKYLKMPPKVLAAMKTPDLRVKIDPQRVDDWLKIMMSQNLVKGPIDLKQLLLQ
jgi:NitT/TauT family transport system substrate-binding protein